MFSRNASTIFKGLQFPLYMLISMTADGSQQLRKIIHHLPECVETKIRDFQKARKKESSVEIRPMNTRAKRCI
jgi:hypothetical protein